jgi:hypothetical protein
LIGGVELRRERNLGEIVSDAFAILLAAWRPLALVVIPVVAFSIATQLAIFAVDDDISNAMFDNAEIQKKVEDYFDRVDQDPDAGFDFDISPVSIIILIASVPIGFLLTVLTSAALVVYLDRTDRGETLTSSDALDIAQGRLGPMIGATIRATAIILLLCITVIGIPFAIYRMVRWCFLSMVVMIESIAGQPVLARSAELVQGQWWNTLGRLLVVYLVISIPTGIFTQAVAAAFPGIGGILLSAAATFITTPFGIIGVSLMFFDRQARKEPQPHDQLSPA